MIKRRSYSVLSTGVCSSPEQRLGSSLFRFSGTFKGSNKAQATPGLVSVRGSYEGTPPRANTSVHSEEYSPWTNASAHFEEYSPTGGPYKRRVCLYVRNIKKCMGILKSLNIINLYRDKPVSFL